MIHVRTMAALLALAGAACGKYANVAQKLDVTARVVGDTWIARGATPDELRVLVLGTPDANGAAPFSFSSVLVPISAGTAVYTFQGVWVETGSAGATTLNVQHEYTYPDESSVSILNRTGTTRSDDQFQIAVAVTRTAGQLAVTGDPRVAGTYVAFVEALGLLASKTPSDAAACAFQVANIPMLRSQGRMLGFGGPRIQQYSQPATYVGTVAGSLRISFDVGSVVTTVVYTGFQDVGGVEVDGPMVTNVDWGGNGYMSSVMSFKLMPVASDGTPGTPITGTIDYGGGGDSSKAIRISGGNPVSGVYITAIDADVPAVGGGTAEVPTNAPPSPSVPTCLDLP